MKSAPTDVDEYHSSSTQRSGEWDDPPGKLALLYDPERIAALLRDGGEPFHAATVTARGEQRNKKSR